MRALLEEGVWLSFFSRAGAYRGRLQPPAERGGKLRVGQWERSRDARFCLEFGRNVVRGKILGQKKVAAAYAADYLAETLGDAHTRLREALERVESIADLDELRDVEGAASRAYFDLNRSEMPFEGAPQARGNGPHQRPAELRLHAPHARAGGVPRGSRGRPHHRLLPPGRRGPPLAGLRLGGGVPARGRGPAGVEPD